MFLRNSAKFTGNNLCQRLNFIKKEALVQVFYCEFCETSKNTFFAEHLRATASSEGYLHYFLIRKLKRKKPYLLTLGKKNEKQMDFNWNCLLGKFQSSQLDCTPCSKRCKIRCSRKTVCVNDIQQVYRVM